MSESVQAWQFGPVIYSLYREFKEFGDQPISRRAIDVRSQAGKIETYQPTIGDDEFVRALLRRIWDVYGTFTAVQLANMTHAEGSPWHQVLIAFPHGLPMGINIPDETIRDYFRRQAA